MSEYKRLTTKDEEGNWQVWEDDYSHPFEALQVAIDRLAEFEDKIEQGTLIELPCKVGDTVYLIEMDWDEDCKSFYYITETDFMFQYLDYFGAYCFLTREEAEKRLKELQE